MRQCPHENYLTLAGWSLGFEIGRHATSKFEDESQNNREEQAQFLWAVEDIFHLVARFLGCRPGESLHTESNFRSDLPIGGANPLYDIANTVTTMIM